MCVYTAHVLMINEGGSMMLGMQPQGLGVIDKSIKSLLPRGGRKVEREIAHVTMEGRLAKCSTFQETPRAAFLLSWYCRFGMARQRHPEGKLTSRKESWRNGLCRSEEERELSF